MICFHGLEFSWLDFSLGGVWWLGAENCFCRPAVNFVNGFGVSHLIYCLHCPLLPGPGSGRDWPGEHNLIITCHNTHLATYNLEFCIFKLFLSSIHNLDIRLLSRLPSKRLPNFEYLHQNIMQSKDDQLTL